jgi:insulysin
MTVIDKSQVILVLKTFLTTETALTPQQVEPVLKKLELDLGAQLKELGLVSTTDDAHANGTVPKPIVISDVPIFKASLPVSTGPVPVTDLTEFEDFDAKL